jgi:hypothetical protein
MMSAHASMRGGGVQLGFEPVVQNAPFEAPLRSDFISRQLFLRNQSVHGVLVHSQVLCDLFRRQKISCVMAVTPRFDRFNLLI